MTGPRAGDVKTATPRSCDAPRALFLVQIIVLVDYVAVGAMRTIMPYYAKTLGASARGVGALETLYGLGQVAGALFLGQLSDSRGRRLVLLLSFVGACIGYGCAGLAVLSGSAALLFSSRLPVGLAKQTLTASRAIVSDLTSMEERSSSHAALFASSALGYAIGPYIGGKLLDVATPRGLAHLPAFLCALLFCCVLGPLTLLLLPETRAEPAAAPNGAFADPHMSNGSSGANGGCTGGSTGDGTGGGSANASWWTAWRHPRLRPLLLACALPEAALLVGTTALPLYAQQLEWTASDLGTLSSVWGLLAVVLSLGPLGAHLRSGRMRERAAVIGGAVMLGMGGVVLTSASPQRLWGSLAFYAPAVALLRTAPAALISKVAPEELRGRALGALDAIGSCARVVVPLLTGMIAERWGVTGPFMTQAILSLVGTCVLLWTKDAGSEAAALKEKRHRE